MHAGRERKIQDCYYEQTYHELHNKIEVLQCYANNSIGLLKVR